MSMISAQIDELRELVGDGSMEWVAGPVRASVLREAADTIWQLRDDLQRANAAVRNAEHDESMAWDRVRKAESENAKLRELVRKVEHYEQYGCHECPHHDGCDAHTLYDIAKCTMQLEIERDKRELGIEAD